MPANRPGTQDSTAPAERQARITRRPNITGRNGRMYPISVESLVLIQSQRLHWFSLVLPANCSCASHPAMKTYGGDKA
jgi:hypothetical protein